MEYNREGSVSKGVFVYKGKKSASPENYSGGGKKYSKINQRLFGDAWKCIDSKLQVLQTNLNRVIFDDLLAYVKNVHTVNKELTRSEISTAALITGVNCPDHAAMFSDLAAALRAITPFCCQLRSKDCPNVKSIVRKTVCEIMKTPMMEEDELEESTNMKRVKPTMSVLAQWYEDKQRMKSQSITQFMSPRKRKRAALNPEKPKEESGALSPVVIIFQDLEAFPAHALQDFLTICSNHVQRLPIVLVLGIATSVSAVHTLLPHAVSSLLSIEKFQAPPSSEYLTSVVNEVLMTAEFSFKLSHKVFTFLLDIFLFHDFSVHNFMRGLQFSMLDHFYSHPYSVLCRHVQEAKDSLTEVSSAQLADILQLSSLQRYVEEKREERLHLLTDNAAAKECIAELLEDISDYHHCYFPVLKCLHIFACQLPQYPIGRQIREMYCMNLNAHICDAPGYKEALMLIKAFSRVQLIEKLQACQNNLHCGTNTSAFAEIQSELSGYLEKLGNIEELQRLADAKQQEAGEEEVALPKKTNMYALRQKLQQLEKKKKKISVFEEVRNDAIDFMDSVYRRYLSPPTALPLHEVYYYDDVSVLRRVTNGCPRAIIQSALSDPAQYLKSEKLLVTESGSISQHLPDLCIVFKLHLECGRMINLYDWLQAFITITTAGKEEQKRKRKDVATQETRILQARFIRAVSELQFLGFIKPTKRKTDHVSRLTWGGC